MSMPSRKLSSPKRTYSGTIRQPGKRSGPAGKSAVESRTSAVLAAVSSTRRLVDRADDVVEILVLVQARPRARLEEGGLLPLVRGRRQADDGDVGAAREHGAGRLDAVEAGEPVVHEDDVRPQVGADVRCLGAVADRRDD